MCVRITYGSFDRYDFLIFFLFLSLSLFFFLHCSASDYMFGFSFPSFFFASGKHASILRVFGKNGGGSQRLPSPGLFPPAKLGYLQSWGCLKRLQLWLGVARPVPAVCAIDLH